MTVQEAIQKIHAPKGVSSILTGIMQNDFSVLPHQKAIGSDLDKAEEQVKIYQKQLDECKSDWSYWSILGDLSYWESVRDILEAGTLDNGIVADVPAPDTDGVVMDVIGRVSDFGKQVLSETRLMVKSTQ